jgi:hypothetical protein
LEDDDFQHVVGFYYFDEVKEGMGPIQLVPNGKTEAEVVPMIVPGESICLYIPYTLHAASAFKVPGHRAVAWVGFS